MIAEKDFDAFAISEMLCDGITTRETMLMRRAWNAATERAAKQVPMNWLDSMLTGPDRVPGIDKADAQTIEALLRRVAAAIRGTGGEES